MNIYLFKEVQLLFLSILFGIGILLYYDCFRVIRMLVVHKNCFVAMEDLFFWITISVTMFSMFYYYNNGEIRFYCILGMGIGMIAYSICLSEFFIKGNKILFEFLKKFLRKNKKRVIIVYSKMKQFRER